MRSTAFSPTKIRGSSLARYASAPWILAGILVLGFLIRLVFIQADGFSNDVGTFESWSLTLNQYGPRGFFQHAGFADYPPGYFFVLWFVGHVYGILTRFHSDPTYAMLKTLVKMPAIVMDLVDAWLVYAIAKRFASPAAAIAAAAVMTFNPAVIFISAYWGQVDSVAAGFTMLAILLMMRAYDAKPAYEQFFIVGAWAALAYSILIKPPAALLVALFLGFVFVGGREAIVRRAIATGYGIVTALALAYFAALTFHPDLNPVSQALWLYGRYAYASGVYPYDSVNAFNLYAVFLHFWTSDQEHISFFGATLPLTRNQAGIGLLVVAVGLVVRRFTERREPVALMEGAMILSLAFFVLSTRMHERYIFNGLALAIPLVVYRRRYLVATVFLTFSLFANLVYSMAYLKAASANPPIAGIDTTNLMPLLSHPLAALNVVTLFYLGYVFFGTQTADVLEDARMGGIVAIFGRVAFDVRAWFSPIEGVARMTRRDWTIGGGLALASFALSFVNYWWPSEKIFDEIYYARAGEEYLTHANVSGFGVFEFTHPPLTKLLITLSMIFFGGMPHGDWAGGWRFLNLVVGALMVLVCYAFAKRLLASTMFATFAAGFLLFDGFHFVQSRIATPEITVAFFALTTLYCFYRFWTASQVRAFAKMERGLATRELVAFAAGSVLSAIVAVLITRDGQGHPQDHRATLLAFVYFELGLYTAVRLLVPRLWLSPRVAREISFADGSRVVDGVRVPPPGIAPATLKPGAAFTYAKDDLAIAYAGNGDVRYATPDGVASFDADPKTGIARMTVTCAGDVRRAIDAFTTVARGDSPQKWLFILAVSAGCLASCKWNGLFDFFVIWACAIVVVAQPYWSRALAELGIGSGKSEPAGWGNPFGISLDVLVAAMMFVSMTIYVLCYIPFFSLGKNLDDLIGLQQQMYWYHANLKATHPYGSSWWQWPFILRPISYYYHDFRAATQAANPHACCVAEILALPNPLIWWSGLLSVPIVAGLAWYERNKGLTILVVAYVFQWLPWIISPRVAFEYHFFPNLAIICLANAAVLQRVWQFATPRYAGLRYAVYGYAVAAVLVFAFFYPVTAGLHVDWDVWDARMLHAIMGNSWV